MVTYLVGADRGGDAQKVTDAVVSALREKGKDAEALPIGPNKESERNSHDSNYILVFCVNGGQAGATWASFAKGYRSGMAKTLVAYQGWIGNPHTTEEAARTEKLIIEHDAGGFYQPWMDNMIEGHTIYTFVEEYNDCFVGFCVSDVSAEDLAKKIADGTCGGAGDEDDEGSSASTIKEALTELLSYWDGEVECRVENDTVYVNKIPDPEKAYEVEIREGVNLTTNSLTVHDYHPDTVNFLTVHWSGGSDIVKRDEALIARFGEKPLELEATKRITTTETEEEEDTESDTTEVTDETTTETEETTETKTTTKTEEVPVETYEEALEFANIEWAKIRREDGHSVECEVIGSNLFKAGKWCKVYIPTYGIDMFMYITKVSHSDSADGTWLTNVTLNDYPPSLGEYKEEEETGTTEEEEAE